jgi:hypothetical protein
MLKAAIKIQSVIIVFIFCKTVIFAQTSTIRIDFADRITDVSESAEGFVVATLGEKKQIHVLDKEGKTIFTKEAKSAFFPFTQLLSNGNNLLLVTQGYEADQGNSADGTIELIDLKTKQLKWKYTATTGGFVVAPGNKYVATSDVAIDMKTDFVLINIESGELTNLFPVLRDPTVYTTAWLDSIRLCILTYQEQPNPQFDDYAIGFKKLQSQFNSEKEPLFDSLLKAEQQVKEKNDEEGKKQLEAIRIQWGKQFEDRIKRGDQFDREHRVDNKVSAPAKLFILNAVTKKIENDKYLMNVEGTPISISGQYNQSKILINDIGELIIEVTNMSTLKVDHAKIDRNLTTKSYATGSDTKHSLHKEFDNLLNAKKPTFHYSEKSLILTKEKQQ